MSIHNIFLLARLNHVHKELLYYPQQRRRVLVAVGSTNVKVFVKVFKTSLFPYLITDLIHRLYDYT